MTREDINDIINAICPNDEDYEKPCISPKYLRQELEQLALDQRQWNEGSTTKNDIRDNRVENELEPNTKNCESCKYYGSHHEVCNYCYKCSLWTEGEPAAKNDLEVISKRKELAKRIRKEFAEMGIWAYKVDTINMRLNFEMLDIILKALDQEPTIKNNLAVDCISRKRAVETIQKYGVGCFDADEFSPEECERFVISELNKLPSVSPQLSSELEKNSKKLEKGTTKNNLGVDDCVSRILVQSAISKSIEHKENPYQLYKRIDRLPTVIPQESIRQKGKWISYHFGAYYECSNCHERNNSRYDKYCKFCGADMREVEE